jgi:hypothetical protein
VSAWALRRPPFNALSPYPYVAGQRVESMYAGRETYLPGVITVTGAGASGKNNTCDIQYDNGASETEVDIEYLRPIPLRGMEQKSDGVLPVPPPQNTSNGHDGPDVRICPAAVEKEMSGYAPLLDVRTRVYARFQDGDRFYPGAVHKVENGRYTIGYDDGDIECNVAPSRVESQDCLTTFAVGERVLARYRKGRRFFPGVVARASQTYCIRYHDDEVERRVLAYSIRPVQGEKRGDVFKIGQRVEAKYGHNGRYYCGKVEAAQDSKYTILYDDGDREEGVKSKDIRLFFYRILSGLL